MRRLLGIAASTPVEAVTKGVLDTAIAGRTQQVTIPGSNATPTYRRLAVLDGGAADGGASTSFLFSGLGAYGVQSRASLLVHLAVRDANNPAGGVKMWSFGADGLTIGNFYTVSISAYKYELWYLAPQYTLDSRITVLSVSPTAAVDGVTTQAAAPTGLFQVYATATGMVNSVGGAKPDAAGNVIDPLTTAGRTALVGSPMVSQGHSFVAGSGIQSPGKWAEQFAAMFGMIYPTLTTDSDMMRAVAGSSAEEASQRAFGGGSAGFTWRVGDRYPLLLQCIINTSRRTGQDAAARTGVTHCLRGMAALVSSSRAYMAGDAIFTYSTGWTSSTVSTSMSKTVPTIGTSASDAVNVTFTMPAGKAWILILSRNASLSGNTMQIYNMTKGVEISTFNNTNTAASDTIGTYVTIPVEVRATPGDTIRLRAPSATRLGNFAFDGLLVADPNPAPVFMMKEPYLADYSLSTAYPKGSDAVFDYFNATMDTVAGEFRNVIVANPNTAGYWNKNTMIQSDGVHPNAAGSLALAQTLRDAVLAQMPVIIARKALGVAV